MNQRHLLSVTIASLLANASAFAQDRIVPLYSSSPVVLASENSANTPKFAFPGTKKIVLDIPIPSLATATYIANRSERTYFVKVALTNGAKFAAGATLRCQTTTDGVLSSGNVQVGADGANALTLQFPSEAVNSAPIKPRSKSGCYVSFSSISFPSGLKPVQVSAVVQFVTGLSTPQSISYKSDLISFTNALRPLYTKNDITVDVGAASKEIVVGGLANSKYTAKLGTVSYYVPSSIEALSPLLGTNIALNDAVSNLTLTVSSPAFSSVSTTGGVYLSKVSNCDAAAANLLKGLKVVTGANNSVSFTLASTEFTEISNSSVGVSVCFSNKGKNSISKGETTIILTGTANGSYRPSFGNPGNLALFKKNGASTRVLNIPSPTISDDAFIRINNMTNQGGKVFGTLYSQEGVVLGTPNVELGTLTSLQTLVLSPENLVSLFGVTEWAGRAWMQVDAEVKKLSVQNLVRMPDGTLINMSDGVKKVQ